MSRIAIDHATDEHTHTSRLSHRRAVQHSLHPLHPLVPPLHPAVADSPLLTVKGGGVGVAYPCLGDVIKLWLLPRSWALMTDTSFNCGCP